MTSKVTASCIIITWTASAILASVPAFTLISTKLTNNCTSPYSAPLLFYPPVTQYVAITLILSFTYTRILIIAKKQHSKIQIQNLNVIASIAGGNPQVANQAIRMSVKTSEFKAARMIGIVVFAYVGFWFPFLFGRALNAAGNSSPFAIYMMDIGVCLGLTNSSLNWIIYGSTNQDFRSAFKRILKFRSDQVSDT